MADNFFCDAIVYHYRNFASKLCARPVDYVDDGKGNW